MNAMADVKVIKTAAETALAHAYARARERLPGDGAIAAQRATAFDLFVREGLPHRRVEEWKYTDLRALMREGAVIRIGAGSTTGRPLHLIFVASEKPAATFVRSLVVVEKGARAMLIESHEGPPGSEYQVNAALELFVGDGAHVDHVKIIGEGADALHVSTLAAAIGG